MTESSASMTGPFGAACSAVPKTGKGSFDGMSSDPVATAASNNPLLSTLVTAVKQAGLVDTLNNAKDITVFAPTNDAFKGMDQATLKKALGDKALLTSVLTGHVVAGRLAPEDLAGKHQTLNKDAMVTVTGSGESFKVNGNATVLCGNVQTANATVYIIDEVLLPKS
ncbi:MAG TPA: fasciclin domain-containing protein [Propionibacteriaceae bacterium]|nr:fasciclin domain-containing protein [Propionibacteriaceae bacterium]